MRTRRELANALRMLAVDAIEKAKSGHPGAPMGMADIAESLWRHFLRHNPANPQWMNRDRFVLSNGHASMLLYGLLHLSGYDLSIEDLKNFRQFGSKTPGHPEYGLTPGVECTTGPLGQGIAMAVGMALAEKILARHYNRPGFSIIDHRTYVFVGDGCLMEGISQEAISMAGTLGLGKLTVLYDDNGISIDGDVKQWFADDTPARFEACGWNVVRNVDGHDPEAVDAALRQAVSQEDRPTLICCRTVIGFGSPNKSGKASCHGSPLGESEQSAARKMLDWPYDPFEIPEDIRDAWDFRESGARCEAEWNALFQAYAQQWPDAAEELTRRMAGILPEEFAKVSEQCVFDQQREQSAATRVSGKNVLDAIEGSLPELFGGSVDLSGSVGTYHQHAVRIDHDHWEGNYLSYGVREFLGGAIMNGMALHGGFIPYSGTFLVFSDYARGAIRLSALMQLRVIWVLTHDSIGLGEDGPTHQPIEHLASLRVMPGIDVWRPCDGAETAVAWKQAIEADHPSCLVMSRQKLSAMPRTESQLASIFRGGYILRDCEGMPELILIATGSEVGIAVEAAQILEAEGHRVRVVSMPCTEAFDRQNAAYKESVLPSSVRTRVAVEAGAEDIWRKYVGLDGAVVGMKTFGESAPASVLFEHFGFTARHVADAAAELLRH